MKVLERRLRLHAEATQHKTIMTLTVAAVGVKGKMRLVIVVWMGIR